MHDTIALHNDYIAAFFINLAKKIIPQMWNYFVIIMN